MVAWYNHKCRCASVDAAMRTPGVKKPPGACGRLGPGADAQGSIDHQAERPDIGLQRHEDAHQAGQGDGVEEHVAQDVALMVEPARGRGGDDDG
ncbi:hypothetical protein HZZ02_23575, partial [Streptococcus danieliae]|nr:hypothetical protein [Streptococcus danieliae]